MKIRNNITLPFVWFMSQKSLFLSSNNTVILLFYVTFVGHCTTKYSHCVCLFFIKHVTLSWSSGKQCNILYKQHQPADLKWNYPSLKYSFSLFSLNYWVNIQTILKPVNAFYLSVFHMEALSTNYTAIALTVLVYLIPLLHCS